MHSFKTYIFYLSFLLLLLLGLFPFLQKQADMSHIPVVAIANYGPHSSLDATIAGFKKGMQQRGYIEGQNISYVISDVGFDASLIPQMIAGLKSKKPTVMVVMSTPVASIAQSQINDLPLVFSVVTDPVAAGLLDEKHQSRLLITGSSDEQDLGAFLDFARLLLPEASRVGLLYSTAETNDQALLRMMREAAAIRGIDVVAIPIDEARDVALRVQEFKSRVDFIYVGTSGPIQPTLPVISALAEKMGIPVFNADSQAVYDGLACASFGVDYLTVGAHTASLVDAILQGNPVSTLSPVYPGPQDHDALVNRTVAHRLGIKIPYGVKQVGGES